LPRAALVTLPVATLLLAGCGSKENGLAPESRAAHGIVSLWWNMLAGAALGFALVAAILLAAYVRRNRAGVPRAHDGDRVAFGVVLAFGIVIPILVLSSLFLFGNIFLIRDTTMPTAAAAAASERPKLTVRVTGHQFWWEVRYPGTAVVTANEIHIPVRTPVRVLLHTDDVIHSLWIPQLNRKTDLLPEQTNQLLLYAEKAGRYRGGCYEYCGLQHAHMGIYVFAEPAPQFRAWLARQAKPASVAPAVFLDKCASCHAIRGTAAHSGVGPDLTHVGSRTSLAALTIPNTPVRLREWLQHTQRVKPGSEMPDVPLTDAQVRRLVSYLESRR
jgi:cytochrome c oxidase subunit II